MTLYLYRAEEKKPLITMENIVSYTDNRAVSASGTVYAPFAPDCELSSKADCSETLRADWRTAHPDTQTRLDELEALLALLLFGGEDE